MSDKNLYYGDDSFCLFDYYFVFFLWVGIGSIQ